MGNWVPDILGDGYEQCTLELGPDPDGEGDVVATLVRHTSATPSTRGAVLYVHGYTDYFFQTGLAEHLAAQGLAFFALDLRKCGRSIRPGHTPHYTTDLVQYDQELDRALSIIRAEHASVVVVAHSTGGIITPLWLDRRRDRGQTGVQGLVLNSPWFDLQGPPYYRHVGTLGIDLVGRLDGMRLLNKDEADAYGVSLHASREGEWDYDLEWKPLNGFPVRLGWLRAVRRGHAQLHRGLDVGCPSLVLRSVRTRFATHYTPEVDTADAVLDVRQIARWAGCLGGRTSVVPLDGARHDVFLSQEPALTAAYAELTAWLDATVPASAPGGHGAQSPSSSPSSCR
ncbi:alpha/beta hydrolase [Rhodococcus antarcticus]|uniref:Alpha/beta hydrolase n=1 Tax=Rhodococcus antarcticus TaxID=2987751 RepID=A0ABY6P271_9NOCA|nr:alpha/beta hydrolase [Rhodococcus antarcticus]UZJ25750.1 alpha/beta hydrolase [Rhodococcus antarcticus]